MKRIFGYTILVLTLAFPILFGVVKIVEATPAGIRYERTIIPETDSVWELGTSTKAWVRINTDELCLTADTCKTAWPAGGSGSPGGLTTHVQYNNAGSFDGRSLFTFSNSTGDVTIGGDLNVNSSDFNLGNGRVATSTLSGGYGTLGLASTSPFGQFVIEALQGVVGSSTPIFVIGDSGTSTPIFFVSGINGFVGIATDTPGSAFSMDGDLIVGGNTSITGNLDIQGTCTGCGAGGGTPGGADTNVQYNSGGSFAGDSLFTYIAASGNVDIGGDLSIESGDFNLGNVKATTTLRSLGGRLGIYDNSVASTSPYGLVTISGNTTTPALIIDQSGTGGIIQLANSTNELLRVDTDTNSPVLKMFYGGTKHPVTTFCEGDCFYRVFAGSTSAGGVVQRAMSNGGSSGQVPFTIQGINGVSGQDANSIPTIFFSAGKFNGSTGIQNLGADEIAFRIGDTALTGGSGGLGGGTSYLQVNGSGFLSLGGTTTPRGQLTVDPNLMVGSTTPAVWFGDQGTSSPAFMMDGIRGRIGFGTNTPYAQVGIEMSTDHWAENEGIPAFVVSSRGTSTPAFSVGNMGSTTIYTAQVNNTLTALNTITGGTRTRTEEASLTIDCSEGNYQEFPLTSDIALNMKNCTAGQTLNLGISVATGGDFQIDWNGITASSSLYWSTSDTSVGALEQDALNLCTFRFATSTNFAFASCGSGFTPR